MNTLNPLHKLHAGTGNQTSRQKILDDQVDYLQRLWIDGQVIKRGLYISERTLLTWRKTGKLTFSKIGSKIYYKMDHVLQLLESSTVMIEPPKNKK